MEELKHIYVVDWYLPEKEEKEKIKEQLDKKIFLDYAKQD